VWPLLLVRPRRTGQNAREDRDDCKKSAKRHVAS
jgi:hypothetical protein